VKALDRRDIDRNGQWRKWAKPGLRRAGSKATNSSWEEVTARAVVLADAAERRKFEQFASVCLLDRGPLLNPLLDGLRVTRKPHKRLFGTGPGRDVSEGFLHCASFPSHPELLDWFRDRTRAAEMETTESAFGKRW